MRLLNIALFLFCLSPLVLLSGDDATFTSLGLSPQGRYFAFAQYGEQDGSGFPYAEIYIVDVKKNSFVAGGVVQRLWRQEVQPLPTGLHVLLDLRAEAESLFKAYKIMTTNQPETIIQATEKERVRAGWNLDDSRHVLVALEQKNRGVIGTYSSSAAFQLKMSCGDNDSMRIGAIDRFRKHVIRYDIDRVLALKDKSSIIFVIRMTKMGFEGADIRYMVETYFNKVNPG